MEEIVFENLGKRTTDDDIRDFLEVTKTLNYLLIDGSLWDGDAETACLLNPNFRSLYRGAAAEKWGSVAPLLFSMEPKSTFERWVRKKDPIERRVVWLYAECDIDELRQHLRRFTIVKQENKSTMLFRYYDPHVLISALPHLSKSQAIEFFNKISYVVIEDTLMGTREIGYLTNKKEIQITVTSIK